MEESQPENRIFSPPRQMSAAKILAVILLALVIISLPYLPAWAGTPTGMTFTGALLNPDDMSVYVSAMRQGANGHWLYHFTYSPEPWQPRLMLLLYLVLGKITAVFTTPTVFTLHLWRTLLAAFSMLALLVWVRTVFPNRVRQQWMSWLLILFGSGVGWIAVFLFDNAAGWSPDLGFAEWSPLIALFNTPHFALGLGLEALFFALVLRMNRKNGTHHLRWAMLAALVGLLDSLVYVYHLAIIGLVVGFLMPALAYQARRIPWRQWGYGALVLLPQLPLLYYYAFQTSNDPYWTEYITTTHIIRPPSVPGILVGLGGLGVLAVIGGRWWLKQGHSPLLPIWAVVNLAALYLPGIHFSGRFALGLMIPVATLAAAGLESAIIATMDEAIMQQRFAKLTLTPIATLRRAIFILLLPSTLMNILLFIQGPRWQPDFPYYLPTADVEAAKWLGEHTDETAVTFTYYPLGNYLPQVYDGKVYMGQLDFTTDLDHKLARYDQFWQNMSADERAQFLAEWHVTHILIGSYEANTFPSTTLSQGTVVYETNGIRILSLLSPDFGNQ